MDLERYDKIKAFCTRFLLDAFRNRHLEDLIQFVAMKDFESDGMKSWKWSCCDYCRDNGLTFGRGKVGAKALENSLSIDAPGLQDESENSNYLLDRESISRSDQDDRLIHHDDNMKGALEGFLSPFNFSNEVMKWITKSYKVKMN